MVVLSFSLRVSGGLGLASNRAGHEKGNTTMSAIGWRIGVAIAFAAIMSTEALAEEERQSPLLTLSERSFVGTQATGVGSRQMETTSPDAGPVGAIIASG
jgi:hypothetical protein